MDRGARPTRIGALLNRWLVALALAATLWVQWPALLSFFSADDLVHLQQAAGIVPTSHQPWRVLTQVLYVRAMLWFFGPWPLAFMAVNLALHAVNVVLVALVLKRFGVHGRVAGAASALFGACPLLVIVVGHAVVIDDIAALTFALLTLRGLTGATRREQLLGTAAYGVGLFCKESMVFLPLLALWPRGHENLRQRVERLVIPITLAGVFAVSLLIAHFIGAGPGGAPYSLSAFPAPFHNLMTYTRWFYSLNTAIPDLVRAPDPTAWRVALPALATLAGIAWRDREARDPILFGLTWWIVGLAPVLGLEHSAYTHYAYVALPGLALATAASLDAVLRLPVTHVMKGDRRAATLVAMTAIVIAVLGWRGERLVAARYTARLPGIDLPLDPQIRSMVVARRAVSSLASRISADTRLLAILTPPGMTRVFGTSGREYAVSRSGAARYDLQREVLSDGRALRVFFPALDTVVYVDRWSRRLRDFDMAERAQTGEIVLHGRSMRAHVEFMDALKAQDALTAAAEYLDSLRAVYPNDSLARVGLVVTP